MKIGKMALAEHGERVARDRDGMSSHGVGSGAIIAECPTVLGQILHPDISLAIWRRDLSDDLVAELAGVVPDEVDDILLSGEGSALDHALADAMEAAGYPDMPAFRRDIAMLGNRHAAVTGETGVRIRLEVVETDACRKFHADYVTVRTITTYLGRGTQWIEAETAEGAGSAGGPPIAQVPTGSVAMFKGRLWRENQTILHRSPPIGDSGEQRLVLVIDTAPAEDRAIRLGGTCA